MISQVVCFIIHSIISIVIIIHSIIRISITEANWYWKSRPQARACKSSGVTCARLPVTTGNTDIETEAGLHTL